MVRFLHIVSDDKFIDMAISLFRDVGGKHRFVCVVRRGRDSLEYIKSDCVECCSFTETQSIIKDGSYDAICFHKLYSENYPFVLSVPERAKVIWLSWGADVYYAWNGFSPLIRVRLYRPLTRRILDRDVSLKKRIKRCIKHILPLSRNQRVNNQLQAQVISRVDMCSTIIRSEYDYLRKLPFFNAAFFPFNYVRDWKEGAFSRYNPDGDFILVNNSADLSGNHFDVLDLLKRRGIVNPRLIPVSYGKDKEKIQSLIGPYVRKNIDVLLADYLDINDYRGRVSLCRVAVFGHIRQQAMGNIILCLRLGMKVFLYKNSLVYHYFKKVNVTVFSIEDDLLQSNVDEPLTESIVSHNVKILSDLYDYDLVKSRVRQSLEKNGLMI